MPLDENYKEVLFDQYCEICQNRDLKEEEAPCLTCLETPARIGTQKPVCWVARKGYEEFIAINKE